MTASAKAPTPRSLAQLTAAWDVRGIDIATVQADADTVLHTRRRLLTGSLGDVTLPPLLGASEGEPAPFTMGRTIGEGGMGIVRVARQVALEREVAIKTLRPEVEKRAGAQLLREARVTGALEHPNIVPVYALGRGEDGQPVIVMKRVDGTSWEALLDAREEGERGRDAYLRRHLEILRQVAAAVDFAHGRGIVHRDIKPANVMVGRHREVYLVDWGIAVSSDPDGVRGVPLARDVAEIEGTPAYMAPEMAAGDGSHIGAASDVYLLGATLHHVLTGDAPHDGQGLVETLTAAFASKPKTYGDHVPAALAAICRRAMAVHPDERFANAGELAEALTRFLDHREAARLLESADRDLERLHELAEEEAGDELYATFDRCRFAYSFALREWEDSEPAREGLDRAVRLMVEMELSRGAPDAAATLLRELPSPDPELGHRVREAQRDERAQRDRLTRLRDNVDLRAGAGARVFAGIVLGVVWFAAWMSFAILTRTGVHPIGYAEPIAISIASTVLAGALMLRAYRQGASTVLARRLALSMPLLFVAHAMTWTVMGMAGAPLVLGTTVNMLVCSVGFGATTVYIDRANAPMVLALVVGLGLVLLAPEWHLEIYAVASALGTAATVYATWYRPKLLDSDVMPSVR